MPIVDRAEGPALLFTRRPATMSAFAGQLSFPGGRIDARDATPLAAALRETREEIGLPPRRVRVWGYFTELLTHLGTLVICYGGLVRPADVVGERVSPQEVEEVLWVPLRTLLRPGPRDAVPNEPHAYVAEAYESRLLEAGPREARTMHYWTLRSHRTEQKTVLWGLTAEIVSRVLVAGFAWKPARPPRRIRRREEILP